MTNYDYYTTQSLNVAAFLMYKDLEVVKSETIKGITTFYFKREDAVYDALAEYNSNVELKKFITSFREVKRLIRR